LDGKPKGKRPLRRQRHRWEDTIRTDLKERGWEDIDWIYLAQDMVQCIIIDLSNSNTNQKEREQVSYAACIDSSKSHL